MASQNMCACGMHACGKCSPMILLFGILFLIYSLGFFGGFAGHWYNPWTIFGVFFVLWGGMSMMK